MLSKASLHGTFRYHLNHLSLTAGLHQRFPLPAHAPSTVCLSRGFFKSREVHHIPKSSSYSLLQMQQKPWHPTTCQTHSNSIQKLCKFCMFFFSHFGFQFGLGPMSVVPAVIQRRVQASLVQHCCTPADPQQTAGQVPQGFSQFRLSGLALA